VDELVLASASPTRLALLRAAGVPVRGVPAAIDERAIESVLDAGEPTELALVLADAKASEVRRRIGGGLVLGADQVLWDGAAAIGKPANAEEHFSRLRALAGRSHELVTGWVLLGPDGARRAGIERTRLWLRDDLTDAELRAYVASGEGDGCAGGYAIEGHAAWLFERIDGDYFNVLGLPLLSVLGALRDLGWRYPAGGA
jgi:septum formation protein